MADVARGETLLVAPLATADRIFIGSNSSDFGVRGWMAALDSATGRILWKRYDTGRIRKSASEKVSLLPAFRS